MKIIRRTMKNKDRREILQAFSMLTQLGLSMAACIFIGVLAGKYLDQFFGISPVALIIGAAIGAAASFKVLYDAAIKRWM